MSEQRARMGSIPHAFSVPALPLPAKNGQEHVLDILFAHGADIGRRGGPKQQHCVHVATGVSDYHLVHVLVRVIRREREE